MPPPNEILDELATLEEEHPEGNRRPQGNAEMNKRVAVGEVGTQIRGVTYKKADASSVPQPDSVRCCTLRRQHF